MCPQVTFQTSVWEFSPASVLAKVCRGPGHVIINRSTETSHDLLHILAFMALKVFDVKLLENSCKNT